VLSGYITTLKNKQKLDVSIEGPSSRVYSSSGNAPFTVAVYMRLGRSQTRMEIEIVNIVCMRPVRKLQNFQFFPLGLEMQFSFFRLHVLFQCQGYNRLAPSLFLMGFETGYTLSKPIRERLGASLTLQPRPV
jgi:hypothetical protein